MEVEKNPNQLQVPFEIEDTRRALAIGVAVLGRARIIGRRLDHWTVSAMRDHWNDLGVLLDWHEEHQLPKGGR